MTKFAGFGRSRAIRGGGVVACLAAMLLWGGPAIGAEPLSLDQCIDLALKNNPVLAQSQWQLEGARATHMAGSSAFLPSLHYSLTGGRSRSWVTQNLLPYIDEHTGEVVYNGTRGFGAYSTSYSHRLSLSQNIVNLPDWYRYSASGADLASSREVYRGSRADLVYQVRQEYFSLLGAILLQQNAREALTVSEDQLKRSQALFDVGSVARSDVLQARVTRANAVRDEISARNSVEQSRAQLAVILGKSVQDSVEIRQDVPPPGEGSEAEGALIREALQERPEVRQAIEQLRAARHRYRSAWWEHFPTLALGVDYSKGGARLKNVLDPDLAKENSSWGYALSLNWNLFDGMATYGSVRGARADLHASQERQRQEELNAALGVREAQIAIRNAREGQNAAEEAVALAEENLKLQEALYQNGAGTILELNNAQVERTKAKNSLVEATISLHLANAQLDRALGR